MEVLITGVSSVNGKAIHSMPLMKSCLATDTSVTGGTFSTAISFRFSAKYTDTESGLLYYGYRYRNLVCWLSRDPVEEIGGDNLYALVRNDAVGRIDLFGLEYVIAHDVAVPEGGIAAVGNNRAEVIIGKTVNLLKKFGVTARLRPVRVLDRYVISQHFLIFFRSTTTYEMRDFTQIGYIRNIDEVHKSLRYLEEKRGLYKPVLLADDHRLPGDGYTSPYGVIVKLTNKSADEVALLISHELLAHYDSGYRHGSAPSGWDAEGITRSDSGGRPRLGRLRDDTKISCAVRDWIELRGGNPDRNSVIQHQ